MINRRSLLATLALGLVVSIAPSAFAEDWVTTGTAVRTKSLGFISVNVYSIEHQVKGAEKPQKRKDAVANHGAADKRFILTMLRDVPQEKIKNALSEALGKNRGGHLAGQVASVFDDKGPDLAKGSRITITYTAATKSTLISAGAKSTTIASEENMKPVWNIWFGNIDQPAIGDQLIARLP